MSSLAGQWKPTATAAATESVAGTVCAVELELPEVNPRMKREKEKDVSVVSQGRALDG